MSASPNVAANRLAGTSNIFGAVSGTSAALESIETSFHQDLNGDGTIGAPTTLIESFGSTNLTEVGNDFYLYGNSSGAGPELKYAGAAFVAGQFGAWTPIGVEQTLTGYEVSWKVAGADQYTAWNTDSNGNYVSSLVGVISGSNPAFAAIETSFHQDLNGDGVIGVVAAAKVTVDIPPTSEHISQSLSMGMGNDGFVFAPNAIADAGKAAAIELNAVSSTVIDTGGPAPLQPANDPGANLDNHGITTWTNTHLLDVTANHFIIQ